MLLHTFFVRDLDTIFCLRYTRNGQYIITGSADQSIKVCNWREQTIVKTIHSAHEGLKFENLSIYLTLYGQ